MSHSTRSCHSSRCAGFTQENSIGTVQGHEDAETIDYTTASNRSFETPPEDEGGLRTLGDTDSAISWTAERAESVLRGLAEKYEHSVVLMGKHTVENIAASVLIEELLFDIATTAADVQMRRAERSEMSNTSADDH